MTTGGPATSRAPAVFVDGIHSIGIHNGVVRIHCIRLDAAGQPEPVLELLIPAGELGGLIDGLGKVRR